MWIVQLALRRPYTFIVAALLLLIIGPVMILRTPTDIFPSINVPAVSIVWQYSGLSAHQFEGNITWPYERVLTTTVRSQGTQVAVVDDSNIVHLKTVTVGRDFGTSYEVANGVSNTDRLILNPSDSLANGEKVLVQELPAGKSAK